MNKERAYLELVNLVDAKEWDEAKELMAMMQSNYEITELPKLVEALAATGIN